MKIFESDTCMSSDVYSIWFKDCKNHFHTLICVGIRMPFKFQQLYPPYGSGFNKTSKGS